MNAIRLKKEARALLWPWLTVVSAGALPVVAPQGPHALLEAAAFVGFFIGIPLLATLALGNEFHHRTLALWLSQPCGRMQLWGEKLLVSFAAVVSAALVFGLGPFSFAWSQPDFKPAVVAVSAIFAVAASATYWTLVARSTIGGVALNTTVLWVLLFGLFGPEMDSIFISARSVAGIAAVAACYSGLLLWLGARKMVRFEVTGGAGDDLLMAGPSLMPPAIAGWFRTRPSGVILNLVRKEFRLLRPLWLIALLATVYLAFLATFGLLPDFAEQTRTPMTLLRLAQFLPLVLFLPLMGMLAGILSVGEERTLGTHAWHMTLPVSARRQWLVKLGVAVLAALACGVLLPILVLVVSGTVSGSPFMYLNFHSLRTSIPVMPVLTLAAFWCACATSNTVHAALWVFPVTGMVFYAGSFGMWLGMELARTTGTIREIVLSWFQLSPQIFSTVPVDPRFLLIIPVMVFGVIQSYRLFRRQAPDGILAVVRPLLPLVLVAILCSFAVSAGFLFANWHPFGETREALEKLHPGVRKLEITGDDLASSAALSSLTRRWLSGSRIVVAPHPAHPTGYLAAIHLASGLECTMTVTRYAGVVLSPEQPSCAAKAP